MVMATQFSRYPLSTGVLGHGRRPCRGCGGEKLPGYGRAYCEACSAPEKAAARQREAHERHKAKNRRPCVECRGPKPPGRSRWYCDECESKRAEREADAREAHAAREAERARERAEFIEAEFRRLDEGLALERQGIPLVSVPPVRNSHEVRVDSPEFRPLPTAPLAAKVNALIRRTVTDAPYMVLTGERVPTMDGNRVRLESMHREGAPSARDAVCDRLGIPARRLYNWEHGIEQTCGFDIADKVVTRAGWLWWSVWESGEEYELARRAFEGE